MAGTAAGREVEICVVNPNSSVVVTEALAEHLAGEVPAGCRVRYVTGPASAPVAIQDAVDAVVSAAETYRELAGDSASCYLVACFSDHPLARMLRARAPALHLLDAAVLHALASSSRFGIVTTVRAMLPDIDTAVRALLGAHSARYVGAVATGLGVLELQSGDPAKRDTLLAVATKDLLTRGADAIILGCAAMVGCDATIRAAAQALSPDYANIAIIDGAKAGIHLLAGLARANYTA
jgi:Asp/Glu/hydantoin racemase